MAGLDSAIGKPRPRRDEHIPLEIKNLWSRRRACISEVRDLLFHGKIIGV